MAGEGASGVMPTGSTLRCVGQNRFSTPPSQILNTDLSSGRQHAAQPFIDERLGVSHDPVNEF
jgi:hypothetical protein